MLWQLNDDDDDDSNNNDNENRNDDNNESSEAGNHKKLTGYLLQTLSMTPKMCQNPFWGIFQQFMFTP